MFEDPLRVATARAILESLVVDAYLAIKVGLGAGDVQALVEKAFITAGIQKRTEEGASDPASTDGIAKITGLSRAAVNSLKSGNDVRPKPFQNPGVKVMAAWLSLDEYLEGGQPKIIPIRGKAPSFHALTIATIGKDLRPSSVLKLLHERGVVKTVSKGHVQLVSRSYGGSSLDIEEINQAGRGRRDYGRAFIQQLENREPSGFCRYYFATSPVETERGAILTREFVRGMSVVAEAHERAAAHESEASKRSLSQKERVIVGHFAMRVPLTKDKESERQGSRKKSARTRSLTHADTDKKNR